MSGNMSENKGAGISKRREWVKNAAIIFLSVLLVLTFFSSTIMNWSLPEVATQYVESGTITAKIRGSGTVESADPYSVKLKTSADVNATGVYEVRSVEVRKGDPVMAGDLMCSLKAEESKPLQEAKKALEDQLLQYEIAILQGEASNSVLNNAQSGNISSMAVYQSKLLAKENEIQKLNDQVKEAENTLASWEAKRGVSVDGAAQKEALDKAQAAYNAVYATVSAADEQIASFEAKIKEYQAIVDQEGLVQVSGGNLVPTEEITAAKENIKILKKKISAVETQAVKDARASLPGLKAELDKAQSAYDNKDSVNANNIEEEIKKWTKEVADRKQKVTEAEDAKAKMVSDIVQELQWNDRLSELKEQIEKLEQETVIGEIQAPISGTVMDVYVESGKDTPADGILFTIQPEGKGYTMQFAVTNEQAKRLSVGDVADLVNSWRYDDVEVRLASIKPDPSNPGQNKMLTFDVTGNAVAGQMLNVSVGQKSANYDLTVPNSAIREDNNGKFILIIETKSTPLSNRYIATRVDVEVIASDDTRSAISAALYGYEYVITTATAPVEAGKQVRLANN